MRHDGAQWAAPQREMRFYDAMAGEDVPVPADQLIGVLSSVLRGEVVSGVAWILADWAITPDEVDFGRERILIGFSAMAAGRGTRRGTLEIGFHPSGWLIAVVDLAGFAPEPFFIERVYEEFDIWPPASPCEDLDCGRMSKRGRWLQLMPEHWPHLANLATGRFITLDQPDTD